MSVNVGNRAEHDVDRISDIDSLPPESAALDLNSKLDPNVQHNLAQVALLEGCLIPEYPHHSIMLVFPGPIIPFPCELGTTCSTINTDHVCPQVSINSCARRGGGFGNISGWKCPEVRKFGN